MKRREFLSTTARVTAAVPFIPFSTHLLSKNSELPDLVIASNSNPKDLVQRALGELGGMGRFVAKGDIVVLKPNISWDRVPEQGATTNPEVVGEVVRQCLDAGAKKVKVFDFPLNEPKRCYKRSGIEKAARDAGADVFHVRKRKFKKVSFPEGKLIKAWELYSEALEADKIINIPAAKHHSHSGVSLGIKNLMGFLGGNRGKFHRDFDAKIVDLNMRIRPHLTILDSYRILLRNGPSGGNISDVEIKKVLIAGIDPVAVDSYGATLFGLKSQNLSFLKEAHERGLGELDLTKVVIKTLPLEK